MFPSFGGARMRQLSYLAFGALFVVPAVAQTNKIRATSPWLRETAAGQTAGGGFLTLTNSGKAADTLTGGSSALAAKVDVHTMTMEGGVMCMRPLKDGLPVPAGQTVELKPGGLHIMLTGLKRPLKRGETVPVTLSFAKAGKVIVKFAVQPVTYAGGDNDHRN